MENVQSEIIHHPTEMEVVLTPPDEVYAGAEVNLKVKVKCTENCELLNGKIHIVDEEGTVIAEIDLVTFTAEGSITDEFPVKMPVEPGTYTWKAKLLEIEDDAVYHEGSEASFAFNVIPHHISMSVWGVPLPVIQGSEFVIKVGARCTAGCLVANLPFVVQKEGGEAVSGHLGADPLPQTSGVHWAEQKLVAPGQEGLTTWVVEGLVSELELPHEVSTTSFKLRTERTPDQTLTVEVIDVRKKAPLKGASVYVHPYRSITNEEGVTSLKVTEGNHKLFVKLQDYMDFQTTVEVNGDIQIKVELMYAPDPYA